MFFNKIVESQDCDLYIVYVYSIHIMQTLIWLSLPLYT